MFRLPDRFELWGLVPLPGTAVHVDQVVRKLVIPPNGYRPKPYPGKYGEMARAFYARQFEIPIAEPAARIAMAVIEPGDYGFSVRRQTLDATGSHINAWWVGNVREGDPNETGGGAEPRRHSEAELFARLRRGVALIAPEPPLATLLLLPGWGMERETLLGHALFFAHNGYRVILMDLRGQGQSSGRAVGFGLIEGADIAAVVSELRRRGQVAGKLGIVAFSLGASVALHALARGADAEALLAVAPFRNLHPACYSIVEVFPRLAHTVSRREMARAIHLASRRLGMNLYRSDPIRLAHMIRIPTLYFAGGADAVSPAEGIRKLARHTSHAEFSELPRYTHSAMYFALDRVGPAALAFLRRNLDIKRVEPAREPPREVPENARYRLRFAVRCELR